MSLFGCNERRRTAVGESSHASPASATIAKHHRFQFLTMLASAASVSRSRQLGTPERPLANGDRNRSPDVYAPPFSERAQFVPRRAQFSLLDQRLQRPNPICL